MIGTTISHYKILERLGSGGMGVVYRAEDTKLDRHVALKFLPQDLTRDPESRERFIHEAKAASALQHSNICTIHDIGETTDGQLFIVMDCYEGETLKKMIERGPLEVQTAVEVCTQIAQGLARAHEAGIFHRDIKPANIIVTPRGEVKILDFGLAKLSGRTHLTKTGTTLGTAAYMSPEQAMGEEVDQRADIWSLGVLFYETLTGKPPFRSDSEQAVVYAILNEEPKALAGVLTEETAWIESVIAKCLLKDRTKRYQSVVKLIDDLSSHKPTTQLKLGKQGWKRWPRWQKMLVSAGVIIVLVAAGLLISQSNSYEVKLAILPFVDTSKDSAMAIAFDGLTEDVIANVGQLSHRTKVISFNGVLGYKEKEVTPVNAGKELGVDAIGVCRVYREGSQYSLRLEIVNVRDNTSMSNQKFSSSLAEITLLPKQIAAQIVRAIGGTVTEAEIASNSRNQTKNQDAYRLYYKGNYHYHRWQSEADLRLSLECYRKALELDPQYALAQGGLALSYVQLAVMKMGSVEQLKDSAAIGIQKALSMDEKLPDAHLALAMLRYQNFESPRSIEEGFMRVLALNPSYADGIHFYAHWLSETGKSKRAIEMMLRAVELEPLSAHFQHCLGVVYGMARQWNECQTAFRKLYEMDSTYSRAMGDGFQIRYAMEVGDTATVVRYYKKTIAEFPQYSKLNEAILEAYLGRITKAAELAHRLEKDLKPGDVGGQQDSSADEN